MKTYYVIGLDEDHKPEHTMKIVSRVPVTMDNVSMAFKQLYPNVVIAQEVSGMGVAVCSEKSDTKAALDALAFVCRTLGWLEVVPPYGDAVSRTKECDIAIRQCETIRAALTAQDVNAELLKALRDLYDSVQDGGYPHSAMIRTKLVLDRIEQNGGV